MHSGVGWAEVRCKRGAMRTEDDSKWNKQGFQLPCPSCSCATSAAKLSAIPRRSLLFCPRYGVAVFVSSDDVYRHVDGAGQQQGAGGTGHDRSGCLFPLVFYNFPQQQQQKRIIAIDLPQLLLLSIPWPDMWSSTIQPRQSNRTSCLSHKEPNPSEQNIQEILKQTVFVGPQVNRTLSCSSRHIGGSGVGRWWEFNIIIIIMNSRGAINQREHEGRKRCLWNNNYAGYSMTESKAFPRHPMQTQYHTQVLISYQSQHTSCPPIGNVGTAMDSPRRRSDV